MSEEKEATVYASVKGEPVSRRWSIAVYNHEDLYFYRGETLPRSECQRLERLFQQGCLESADTGYGKMSFWQEKRA
jgi:hypothetical protein